MEVTPGSKKTGAERTREYRERNEQAAKLSVLKFQVKTAQKRETDSGFDKEYRERQADRKRRYQAMKACLDQYITFVIFVTRGHCTKIGFYPSRLLSKFLLSL